MSLPELRGERVGLRPADPDADAAPLAHMLAEPEVARWWAGPWDAERVRREILDDEPGWVVEVAGAAAGWVQFYEEADPDYRHVALDLWLGGAHQGQGLGPEVLRLVVAHFAAAGHHRFTIDPAAANAQAIAAYAKVGFEPVGVLRAYERGPDGTWHDCLLMDLVVTPPAPAP